MASVIGLARIGIEPDMTPFEKAKTAFAAAGAAAGAAIVAGISEAMDQAHVGKVLQAQLGTTDKVAKDQGKLAGRLYSRGISDSFQEAADAIKATVSAGLAPPRATTKQLEAIATKAQDVAKVFGQDIGDVTNQVSQLMKTGLAKNADEAFDVITKGFQAGADKSGDFLDTIEEYSTQFRNMGISGKQATGLIIQGLQAGARDADVVADTIKEFSIEAVAGGERVRGGFKSLKLDADAMIKRFAAGGPAAAKAFDTVLDKLRGIEDPARRNAVAIELFGTKAEDMGKALFALDPSEAAKSLGDVGGAAAKLGETIRSGPVHELKTFVRTMRQNVVEFLGREVVPVIAEAARWFNEHLAPPIAEVARVVAGVLGPALVAVGAVIGGVVGWFREWGVWLAPVAVLIGGVTLALNAQAIATALVTAVFSAYRVAILAGTAVTQGFAAAQALLNSIMALNPITLVVIALVALGAAIVVAWKKSETFRKIVTAAWDGIKVAALFVWNNVLKPAFDGIMVAMRAVGAVAMWLWKNAIQPVFKFIWTAAKVLLAVVAVAVFVPLILAFKAVGAIASWLWKTAIRPAFQAIAAIVKWLYNNVVKPVFNQLRLVVMIWWTATKLIFTAVMRFVRGVLASTFRWLYNNIVKPVFNRIKTAVAIWWAGAKIIFNAVMRFVRGPLASTFRWLYNNVIRPVWNSIKAVISAVWRNGIRPVFNTLKAGVSAVGRAFSAAVRFIGRVWNGLKAVAKRPVQFVVDTVYNNGIRKVWNTVAGFVGLGKLKHVRFADGGTVPGFAPRRDTVPALLSPGEGVLVPEAVRALGGPAAIKALNAWSRGGAAAFSSGGMVQRFANGGVVDWITGAAKRVGSAVMSGVDFLTNPGRMWDKAVKFIRDKIASLGGSQWARAIAKFPMRMLSGLKDKIVNTAKGFLGPGGGDLGAHGGSARSAQAIARAMLGSYGWGPGQMDPLIKLWNGESGWRWNALNASSGAYGIPQCVDLNTKILTRRGWLSHDEVRVGDETIGYSPQTGRSGWTLITHVHHGTGELRRFGTSWWSGVSTPNHRWLVERAESLCSPPPDAGTIPEGKCQCGCGGDVGLAKNTIPEKGIVKGQPNRYIHGHHARGRRRDSEAQSEYMVEQRHFKRRERIVLARPASTDSKLDITVQEAALLAWIAGDGWQVKPRPVKGKHPTKGYKSGSRSMTYHIAQTKEENWAAIDEAVGSNGRVTRTRERRVKDGLRRDREWRLSAPYARDLTERAGNPKTDCVQQVLAMSDEQRAAWLDAIIRAEGHISPQREGRKPVTQISQKAGPVAEAIVLAVYLSGRRPSVYVDNRIPASPVWTITITAPHTGEPRETVGGKPCYTDVSLGVQPVWCVTTDLGTWTARQGDDVFLTGNSLPARKMASAGRDWRTNPATQIRWGLGYIKGRYGSPAGAWAFWNRQSPHWYDNGGMLPTGLSLVYNGTGRPERVLSPQQEAALSGGVTLNFYNHGVLGSRHEVEDWLAGALDNLRRTGRLP